MTWEIFWGVIAVLCVATVGYLLIHFLKQREDSDRRYDEVPRDDGDDNQWGGTGDIGPGGDG